MSLPTRGRICFFFLFFLNWALIHPVSRGLCISGGSTRVFPPGSGPRSVPSRPVPSRDIGGLGSLGPEPEWSPAWERRTDLGEKCNARGASPACPSPTSSPRPLHSSLLFRIMASGTRIDKRGGFKENPVRQASPGIPFPARPMLTPVGVVIASASSRAPPEMHPGAVRRSRRGLYVPSSAFGLEIWPGTFGGSSSVSAGSRSDLRQGNSSTSWGWAARLERHSSSGLVPYRARVRQHIPISGDAHSGWWLPFSTPCGDEAAPGIIPPSHALHGSASPEKPQRPSIPFGPSTL